MIILGDISFYSPNRFICKMNKLTLHSGVVTDCNLISDSCLELCMDPKREAGKSTDVSVSCSQMLW